MTNIIRPTVAHWKVSKQFRDAFAAVDSIGTERDRSRRIVSDREGELAVTAVRVGQCEVVALQFRGQWLVRRADRIEDEKIAARQRRKG